MEGAVLGFLVETFGTKLLSKTYEKSKINPLLEVLEKKSDDILSGIQEISTQLGETQKKVDALRDEIKWEFMSAPIKEICDRIEAKFQRYIKYVSDHNEWERETIQTFVDEILIGDASIENLITLLNHKVYEGEEKYYEKSTQRILESHQTFSNKTGEPAQCVLYKFYSMLLMIELKAFLMQFMAYSIKSDLGQGHYTKEKESLIQMFGMRFRHNMRQMDANISDADRTLWIGDPLKHIESDPLYPEKGTYCFGHTLKHLGCFRRFIFYISNRYVLQHYYLGSRTLNLRFCNYYYHSSTLLNYVITGVRFVHSDKFGKIFLEIEESKLLALGKIDKNTRRIAARCRDEDTSTFSLSQNFSSIVLGCDLELSKDYANYVLTGIQFATQEGQLKLMATFTEFDIESGKLGKRTKEAMSPNATKMMDIAGRSCPIEFDKNEFHDDGNVFGVQFDACHKKSSKNDIRIVPFIDTQKVHSSYMALAGIGLHWRCNKESAGFIAPKLITYPVQIKCAKI